MTILLVHRDGRLKDAEALLANPRFTLPEASVERVYLDTCSAAQRARESAEKEEQERRIRDAKKIAQRTAIGLVVALLVASLAVWQYFEARRQQQTAQEQAQWANAELRRAVETDGRRLAQIAGRYLQEGRPHQAIMVAREAFAPLKEGLPVQERPYVWQAADVLHRALAARPILRKIFRGHKYVVNMAAFSHDGKRIVTAGTDGRMFVLDARTLVVEHLIIPNPETFKDNTISSDNHVNWAAFSPDGERVATANEDGSVRIFRVGDGEPVLKFEAHPGSVKSLAFSPDGLTMLTTVRGHHQARLWSTADGTLVRKLIENADCCVFQGVFSPDGHRIAIAESDAVSVWDARNGKKLLRLGGVKLKRGSMAFSPDGSRLAAGGYEDKVVRVWDAQSGKEVLTLRGHEADMVGSVAFSPDGRHILTTGCCVFAEALVWDARSGARVASLLGHEAAPQGGLRGVRSAAFSPDGRHIVTAGQDHTVRLWELAPAAPARLLRDEGNPRRFQFSPDGSLIAAIGDDTVLVWRPGQDTPVRLPSGDAHDSEFAFSPDGQRLFVVLSFDNEDPIYDSRTLERVGRFSLDVDVYGNSLVTSGPPLSFSPDGSRIVGCTGQDVNRKCRIWDAHSGDERMVLKRVLTATFVGKGDRVMTSGGSFIRLWDAATGSELVQIRVPEGNDGMLQASADGSLVASGGAWSRGAVWDLHTGNLVTELKGAREKSFVQRFTPDGRYVVTTDDIGTVAFWDPTTGELARALHGPPAMIHSIDVSTSGDRLLAGGYDYTVRMWDTLTNKLLFFADLLPHRTSGFPMLPGYGRVQALLRPSVQQALVQLVIGSEPGLLFDLPYNTFDEVVNAAYAAVPYRFTADERAGLELDLFGRPDPRGADLEFLTQPPTD